MEKGKRGKAAPRLWALAVGGELVECIMFIQVSLGELDVNDCGYTFFSFSSHHNREHAVCPCCNKLASQFAVDKW